MILDGGLLLVGAVMLVVLFVLRGVISGIAQKLVSNAIAGVLAVCLAAVFFNVEVALTPVSGLLVVLGGLPGSLLVIGLTVFDLAFTGPSMQFAGSGFITAIIHTLAGIPGQRILSNVARELGQSSVEIPFTN